MTPKLLDSQLSTLSLQRLPTVAEFEEHAAGRGRPFIFSNRAPLDLLEVPSDTADGNVGGGAEDLLTALCSQIGDEEARTVFQSLCSAYCSIDPAELLSRRPLL